jgi:hypothetical protein
MAKNDLNLHCLPSLNPQANPEDELARVPGNRVLLKKIIQYPPKVDLTNRLLLFVPYTNKQLLIF